MIVPFSRASIFVTHAGKAQQKQPLPYRALFRSGDAIGDRQAGRVHGAKSRKNEGANRLCLATHFEYHPEAPNRDTAKPSVDLYAKLPMAMNLTALEQNRKSGELAPVGLARVDMGAVHGLRIPCAGTLTPWNSHLGGEEYEPDARYRKLYTTTSYIEGGIVAYFPPFRAWGRAAH